MGAPGPLHSLRCSSWPRGLSPNGLPLKSYPSSGKLLSEGWEACPCQWVHPCWGKDGPHVGGLFMGGLV